MKSHGVHSAGARLPATGVKSYIENNRDGCFDPRRSAAVCLGLNSVSLEGAGRSLNSSMCRSERLVCVYYCRIIVMWSLQPASGPKVVTL